MTPQQFASELRLGNLLLVPDYDYTWFEKTESGHLCHMCSIVLRANQEIIENIIGAKDDRISYHPMLLKGQSFRFLGFVEDSSTGIHSYNIPGKNVLLTWDNQKGLLWHENGVPLKRINIRYAHQLQNYIYDATGIELPGSSTEVLRV